MKLYIKETLEKHFVILEKGISICKEGAVGVISSVAEAA